jgi:hypothetical protein
MNFERENIEVNKHMGSLKLELDSGNLMFEKNITT